MNIQVDTETQVRQSALLRLVVFMTNHFIPKKRHDAVMTRTMNVAVKHPRLFFSSKVIRAVYETEDSNESAENKGANTCNH